MGDSETAVAQTTSVVGGYASAGYATAGYADESSNAVSEAGALPTTEAPGEFLPLQLI